MKAIFERALPPPNGVAGHYWRQELITQAYKNVVFVVIYAKNAYKLHII
jgi:hypothetical protein